MRHRFYSYRAYYWQWTKNPLNTFKKKLDTIKYTNIPRFRTRCNVFAGALIHSADSADSADIRLTVDIVLILFIKDILVCPLKE